MWSANHRYGYDAQQLDRAAREGGRDEGYAIERAGLKPGDRDGAATNPGRIFRRSRVHHSQIKGQPFKNDGASRCSKHSFRICAF